MTSLAEFYYKFESNDSDIGSVVYSKVVCIENTNYGFVVFTNISILPKKHIKKANYSECVAGWQAEVLKEINRTSELKFCIRKNSSVFKEDFIVTAHCAITKKLGLQDTDHISFLHDNDNNTGHMLRACARRQTGQ